MKFFMMAYRAPILWFLAAVFCFALTPLLSSATTFYFRQSEPCFSSPLSETPRTVWIRNDGYGKGFFGASRNGGRRHKGIDLMAGVGTKICASKSGRVTFAGSEKGGYGTYVEILHPDGFKTCYAHLSDLNVRAGEWVWKNEVIGHSGRTGNAVGRRIRPHLHFEIRYQNTPLNPIQLLDPSIRFIQ